MARAGDRGGHRAGIADLRPAPPSLGLPGEPLPARRAARRCRQRAQRRVDGVHGMWVDVPRRRAGADAARGRDGVRQRRRRDERQRAIRRLPGLRCDRRVCGPELGRGGGRRAGSARRGQFAVSGNPARCGLGRPRRDPQLAHRAGGGDARYGEVPRGIRGARQAWHDLRRLALPPPDQRVDRPRPGVPGPGDHLRPLRRPARHRSVRGQARGDLR